MDLLNCSVGNRSDNLACLDDINDREVVKLLPETLYLSLLLVVGLIGNGLLIFVYAFKFGKKTNRRFYTLCLSFVDFFTCAVGISLHIAMNALPYKFKNGVLCKVLWFPSTVSVLTSGLLLLVIAIDRYMKVCHPYETGISLKSIRRMCALAFSLSVVLSLPAAIMYGKSHVPTGVGNVTGITCDIEDYYRKTQYPKLYNTTLFVVFCITFVSLVLLYFLISRELQAHERKACFKRRPVYIRNSVSSGSSQASRQRDISSRITRMFLVITIVGTVSFTPCLVAQALKYYSRGNITSDDYRLYSIVYNSFFINMVANPFLYGFFDIGFRKYLRNFVFARWRKEYKVTESG